MSRAWKPRSPCPADCAYGFRADEAEEAAGIVPHERIRCGDVLRKEIRASSGAAEDAVSELIREFIDAGHR